MAKPISHPDCVHCRFMVREKNGEYRCRQHDMTLHTPVSLFCKMIASPDDTDADYQQWFQETTKVEHLETNTLYTWVETHIINQDGHRELRIDPATIAQLTVYMSWSAGMFWQQLRAIRIKQRDAYREQGYKIADEND